MAERNTTNCPTAGNQLSFSRQHIYMPVKDMSKGETAFSKLLTIA